MAGIGAYPLLGTRIRCRYGCPLAQGMQLFGKFSRSRFAVVPNDKCRGLGLCTQACPMGIDVAGIAHRDKKPIEIAFGLDALRRLPGRRLVVCANRPFRFGDRGRPQRDLAGPAIEVASLLRLP